MSEQEKQENQKTIVAFAAGLLIGGLLVWIFGGAKSEKTEIQQTSTSTDTTQVATTSTLGTSSNTTNSSKQTTNTATPAKPVMQTGEGKVAVSDQKAGNKVTLDSATFPSDDGWIGVRDYANGQLGGLLGVARFSKEQGLVPENIELQRATKAGDTYAVVFYSENGDRVFNLANDVQVGGVFATFTAK